MFDPTKVCGEHDLPRPCLRCALLCPCGCGMLRDGVSVDVWEAALEVEPFLRAHVARDTSVAAAEGTT